MPYILIPKKEAADQGRQLSFVAIFLRHFHKTNSIGHHHFSGVGMSIVNPDVAAGAGGEVECSKKVPLSSVDLLIHVHGGAATVITNQMFRIRGPIAALWMP